jgi:hypothetical protein
LVYAAYALLVVYLVPPLARHLTETKLAALLQRPVTVTRISLNPFTLCLQARRFEVWEPDGETLFAGFENVELNLDLVLSVLQRGLVVSAVTIDGPHAIVVRRQDGSFNLSDLTRLSATSPPAPAPAPAAAPPRFSVSNIQIRGGWFLFRDEVVKAQQRLTGVQLSIAAVSSLPNHSEVYVQPAFRAQLNGREIVLDSQTKPFTDSQESNASLSLSNLDLTALARYLPEPRSFDLVSGRLDIDLKLHALHVFKQTPALTLSGDIGLRDLLLVGRDGQPLAGLGALQVSVLPSELMQREVHLGRVTCTAPFFRLVRNAQGALVLPQLGAPAAVTAPAAAGAATPPAGPAAPPAVTADIDEIIVQDGRLEFSDAAVSPTFSTTLSLQLGATGLSTRPERSATVHFEAKTESAETLTGAYTVTLFPLLSVTGTTAVKDVRLPRYMPYLATTLASRITRGTLALDVAHEVALPAAGPPVVRIRDLGLALSDFCLTGAADPSPVISLQELTLSAVSADLGSREAAIGALRTRGGQIQVQRFKDGSLNLQKLLRTAAAPAAPVPSAAVPPSTAAPAPWTFTLREAALSAWAVSVDDEQPRTPVHLSIADIALDLKDVSTRAGQKGTLALGLRLNESGALAVTGGFSVQPLAVDLGVKLTNLALKDFQGYVADHLQLLVSAGAVETDLKVVVSQAPDAGFDGSVDGSLALRQFASVDLAHAADFVKARELALRGLHVALRPLAVRLEEVALSGLDTALTVTPDGSLNLRSVLAATPATAATAAPVASPAPAPAAPPAPARAFPLSIGTIRLEGCGVVFTDQQRTPHYRVSLGEVAGTVTGFSLDQPTPAEIALAGRLDGQAPFSLKATLGDLGPQMTLTASTVLQDFELSPLTPYAGRYVGYTVQKGKLNVDLQYTLKQRQLVAEQKVTIDQFAFGQKVDSPDATDLPVRLAVALLKDRKGQISLNVPLRGSLDDPEFSVLRIVLKVLRDLVAKAATAPFAMLGALVGGGEELSYVEFGAGRADLDEAGTKKLETLAKALLERPELQVETGGTVDPTSDRDGLQRQAVLRQIKARKLADLAQAGTPVESVEAVTLSAEERAAYLLTIYRETLAPPSVPAGQVAVAPSPVPAPAEIEQQLLARTTVSAADVNLLAGQRAARVREFLTTTGQVATERVFVVDAVPAAAGDASATAASARQARLSLR